MNRKIVVITGASRGIGAATAGMAAREGADVVINYRSKSPRAEQVANTVRAYGRRALPIKADLTDVAAVKEMMEQVRDEFGRIDILVLNASGGLERDMPADYAMRLNRDAQIQTVDAALPLMVAGSRIVFVTSHYAHFHGARRSIEQYEPVAISKRAGEDALRARAAELEERGIRLVVVSGDIIEGTITATLMNRAQPGLLRTRREEAGALPEIDEFAEAVVEAALNPAYPTGHTIYIGSTE